jgi:hypothetical protein
MSASFSRLEATFRTHLGAASIDRLRARVITAASPAQSAAATSPLISAPASSLRRPSLPAPPPFVIALGGDQLTGKSTLARALASRFGAAGGVALSSGAAFRELAAARGVSLVELLKQAAHEPAIDVQCDYRLCEIIAGGSTGGGGGDSSGASATAAASIVLEGRNPACMASYVRSLALGESDTATGASTTGTGTQGSSSHPPPSHGARVIRIYLGCTPLEQALRFVERECAPPQLAERARRRAECAIRDGRMMPWALAQQTTATTAPASGASGGHVHDGEASVGTRLRALFDLLLTEESGGVDGGAASSSDCSARPWHSMMQPFVVNAERDTLDRQVCSAILRFCFLSDHWDCSF